MLATEALDPALVGTSLDPQAGTREPGMGRVWLDSSRLMRRTLETIPSKCVERWPVGVASFDC
jgi:hypothetical protein